MSNRIRLTDAQVSAIECRSEEEGFELDDSRRYLIVTSTTAEALNEASNAEDDYAELIADDAELKKFARRAAKSLSAVYLKALKLERN